MSAATSHAPLPRPLIPEERVTLYGISWDAYVRLRDTLDETGSHAKLTYLRGTLEIMTVSEDHEAFKTLIARLLEAWAVERNVDVNGYGGMTFRRKAKKRGLEPDECYTLGKMGKRPDIAIEVVISRGVVNKLDVYAGLEVPEVWVYEDGALVVYRLVKGAYQPRRRSEVLPALDVAQLASFVGVDTSQTAQVRAYLAALRSA